MEQMLILYPRSRAEQQITVAEYQLVQALGPVNPAMAIKFLRTQYNLGLYEAKQIVDTIREGNPQYNQPRS